MKAVLEFNYPDDENKLRRSLHADKAFDTLWVIRDRLDRRFTQKAELEDVIRYIREVTNDALKISGEDV